MDVGNLVWGSYCNSFAITTHPNHLLFFRAYVTPYPSLPPSPQICVLKLLICNAYDVLCLCGNASSSTASSRHRRLCCCCCCIRHGLVAVDGCGDFLQSNANKYAIDLPNDSNDINCLQPLCPFLHSSVRAFWRRRKSHRMICAQPAAAAAGGDVPPSTSTASGHRHRNCCH